MKPKFQSGSYIVLFITAAILMSTYSCTPSREGKYIGLQLWSVRNDMKTEPDSTIAKIGNMGYGFIEAAGFSDGKFYGFEPAAFTSMVEYNGLDFLSSHTGQDLPDSASRDKTMEWWDACIAAHKEAGVTYIVQPFMGKAGYESLDGLKKFCEYFNAVGEKCNAAGIRFGYHNHDKEFGSIDGTTLYDFMLENTDPDKVMFEMDLYWAVVGGADPVEYFNKYPGRFELWHVKDKEEVGASGMMDFERIFANREKAGVKYYIVEVEEYNYEPIVSVEKSLEFLNEAEYVE